MPYYDRQENKERTNIYMYKRVFAIISLSLLFFLGAEKVLKQRENQRRIFVTSAARGEMTIAFAPKDMKQRTCVYECV